MVALRVALLTSAVGLAGAHRVVQHHEAAHHALRAVTVNATNASTAKVQKVHKLAGYGASNCPCVGIDAIQGATRVTIDASCGQTADYPADLGAHCEAWDSGRHPNQCQPGQKNPAWCEQAWCYVDPCNCEIPTLPKPTSYIPGSKYQGLPVYYSYATCGGSDSYTAEKDKKGKEEIAKVCDVTPSESVWGKKGCQCVGVAEQPGTTTVYIDGVATPYPADTGATCKAWDYNRHDSCKGDVLLNGPDWCKQAWCYVDPCSCNLETPPKTTSYLPDANFQGKPVYYSYMTCGGTDYYTAKHHKAACVNMMTEQDCGTLDKCAWNGKACLGSDLVEVCGPVKPGMTAAQSKSGAQSQSAALGVFGLVLMALRQ